MGVARSSTLRDCDLSAALLNRADLTRADLRGSVISSLDARTALVNGALVDVDQAVLLSQTLGFVVRAADH